ncbi:MAG: hypothetical protein JRN67_12025 [Nitrososphaerota archaeon]|nr:hypothetical protein [Nitrososphaerota archaeon]
MTEKSHSIATRLMDSEIVALNLKLKKDGFESIGDLIRHYIEGSFDPIQANIDSLAKRLWDRIVSLKLASQEFLRTDTALTQRESMVQIRPRPLHDEANNSCV